MASFNFRSTLGFVTDVGAEIYTNPLAYPLTSGAVEYGWVRAGVPTAPVQARDRDATLDRRLAGLNRIANTDVTATFVTNSGSGSFDVTLAIGRGDLGENHFVQIVEVDASQVFQSVLATVVSNQSTAGFQWYDAAGILRTTESDWVNNNATTSVAVSAGNNLAIRIGDPTGAGTGQSCLAHFAYEAASPSVSITSVDGDNTVTDGQQNVPVIVSGFTGDITSVNLKVGVDTIPLTGLTGTGDNYTFNLPDVTSYTADTAGLPLSSATYQNEIEVSDGTDTASINIDRQPKAGYAVIETLNAVATSGSISEGRAGGAPADNSQIYYPTANNTTISATLIITTDLSPITAFLWDVTSGNWEVVTANITAADETAPVITLLGTTPVTINEGDTYVDAGATAFDNVDGDITANIVTVNPVNTAIPANYTVTYNVSDSAGNAAVEVTRSVTVEAVAISSTLNMTLTGIPDGDYNVVMVNRTTNTTSERTVTFASNTASVVLADVPVGTALDYYTSIGTTTGSPAGLSLSGVTV